MTPCATGIFRRIALATAVAGLMALATPAPSQTPAGSGDVFSKLAGPGGRVAFQYERLAEDQPARVRMSRAGDGTFEGFFAVGKLRLETSDFLLLCEDLAYRPEQDQLVARRNVRIEREDVQATAAEMHYRVDTGRIRLAGNPDVIQVANGNRTHFRGMDTFLLDQPGDGGDAQVELLGGGPLHVDLSSVDEAAGGETFAGLGRNVRIVAAANDDQPPTIKADLGGEGGVRFFRATGSVTLNSDMVNLRADELIYRGEDGIVEAVGHVYVKRDNIEADCGRMVYEVETGKITLTIDPDVRQADASSVTRIWDIDYFIIYQREDGGADIEYGEAGQSEIIYLDDPEQPGGSTPSSGEPVEIDVDNPSQLPG